MKIQTADFVRGSLREWTDFVRGAMTTPKQAYERQRPISQLKANDMRAIASTLPTKSNEALAFIDTLPVTLIREEASDYLSLEASSSDTDEDF